MNPLPLPASIGGLFVLSALLSVDARKPAWRVRWRSTSRRLGSGQGIESAASQHQAARARPRTVSSEVQAASQFHSAPSGGHISSARARPKPPAGHHPQNSRHGDLSRPSSNRKACQQCPRPALPGNLRLLASTGPEHCPWMRSHPAVAVPSGVRWRRWRQPSAAWAGLWALLTLPCFCSSLWSVMLRCPVCSDALVQHAECSPDPPVSALPTGQRLAISRVAANAKSAAWRGWRLLRRVAAGKLLASRVNCSATCPGL